MMEKLNLLLLKISYSTSKGFRGFKFTSPDIETFILMKKGALGKAHKCAMAAGWEGTESISIHYTWAC